MITALKDKIDAGEMVDLAWNMIASPQLAGMLAQQGFDGVVLDAQHGLYDEKSLMEAIPQVILARKAALVRTPLDRWDLCQRVLDFGAVGVIAPMINNKSDAEKFVEAVKYPPVGSRSYGPTFASALYGMQNSEYVQMANVNTLALAQIETRDAYDNLDDILTTDGIDGILMGPSDFSISVTGEAVPDAYGVATVDMVANVANRTNEAGKIAGSFTVGADQTKLARSMGYQVNSIALDTHMIASASTDVLTALS